MKCETAQERPLPSPRLSMQAAVTHSCMTETHKSSFSRLCPSQTVRATAYWLVREIAISNNFDYESETVVQERLNLIFRRTLVELTQCRRSVFYHSAKKGPEK
jgi:hypothetical protein